MVTSVTMERATEAAMVRVTEMALTAGIKVVKDTAITEAHK